MTQNGLCATILPISCALGREYLNWRKKILDKHSIIKSIKLPKNLFEPNASTDTCICVFQAHIKNNNIIEKYDFSDDGFELKMRIGRVNINNEQKTIELFNSIPMKAKVTYKDDWLIEKKFDYSLITKIDFVKAKIDFNLINKNIMDELYSNNGNIALNINISDLPLQTDVWKEFKIKQLFDICGKGKDTIKKNSDESEWPCINAKKNNNGIGGFKNNPKKLFDGGKITVVCQGDGGAGMTYYQENKFCATSSVQILKPKYPFNKEIGIFISKLCSLKWKPIYSHGKSITNNILLNETIKLPTTNCGNPDWEFMTKYIKGE
jgi:hypothetical protein